MNWDDLTPVESPKEGPGWDDLEPVSSAPSYTDLAKSKAVEGLGNIGDMREWAISNLPQGLQDYARASLNNPITRFVSKSPTSEQLRGATGVQEVQPQGDLQEGVGGTISTAFNPVSWVGPGGPLIKAGSAALGGFLSAIGAKHGEEAFGAPGRVVGGLVGGTVGGGLAGAALRGKAPGAAIPTAEEVKASKKALYTAADKTGYEVTADAVKNALGDIGQDLINQGHAPDGEVQKFISLLLRNPGSIASTANLGAIQKQFARIARKTETKPNGLQGPTDDAAAADKALAAFREFLQNPPEGVVLGGNPKEYSDALGLANKEAAIEGKLRGVDTRLTRAERAEARDLALGGSPNIDKKIRTKIGALLDNEKIANTLTDEQKAQAERVNSGSTFPLGLLGRYGGHGIVPGIAHSLAGLYTGGASVPISAAILAGGVLGQRGAAAITRNRAQKLSDMIAKDSHAYQQNQLALPPLPTNPGMSPLQAQLLRSAVTGLQNGR